MPNIRKIFLKITFVQQWHRLSHDIEMAVEYTLAIGGGLNVMTSKATLNSEIQ